MHVAERKRARAEPVTDPQPAQPHPAEPPADEVQTRGATNQTGQLPHNAAAGCARARAYFEQITASSDDPAEVRRLAQAALDDVGRFVPDTMLQAARDEVAR